MRLIVVANRLPLSIKKEKDKFVYKQSSGGLATGLKCVKNEMDFIWVGNVTGVPEEDHKEIEETCWKDYKSIPVFISEELNEDAYSLYCNNILWPLLHSFDNLIYNESKFLAYKKFNKKFCKRILQIVQPGDVVWVHDYHLMLLPQMLKERVDVKVAYFLHTPFPSDEVFYKLPNCKEILRGMLASDKIAFHLPEYRAQFIDACKKCLNISDFINENKKEFSSKELNKTFIKDSSVKMNQSNQSNQPKENSQVKNKNHSEISLKKLEEGSKEKCKISQNDSLSVIKLTNNSFYKTVKGIKYSTTFIETNKKIELSAIPIGIDPKMFTDTLKKENVQKRIKEIKEKFKDKKIILGVDRTDYIKGMPHRMKAYEQFIKEYGKNAVYLQVAVPSRLNIFEYSKLVSKLMFFSGEINNEIDNSDVFLLNSSVNFEELCALYASADVLLITSLRDGMNLVALEYLACQEINKGVLVLSKFAGAVDTLPGCLVINPWCFSEVTNTLNKALNMSSEEKERRYSINKGNFTKFTAVYWAKKNVEVLLKE